MQTVREAGEGSVRGGRQISHTPLGWKCEPSTIACSSHFLVPAAVFFLPPFNPDCGEVAACGGDNARFIVVTDFPYIQLLWYKNGMTISLQSKAVSALTERKIPVNS